MSSVCSMNSSTSPDVESSNVSINVLTNELCSGRVRGTVADIKKDNKYWERRRRNNEAARRSREKRRMNDMSMDSRIMDLAERNKKLEQELIQLRRGSGASPNTAQSAPGEHHSKKSKLTAITPAIDNHTETTSITTTLLNGMVFPIFTTINPDNGTPDMAKSIRVNGLHNSSTCSSKISIQSDDNRFQTNLLTLANIPLLSNIIASTNYNEDISTKSTLLLPFPFSSKLVDQTGLVESPREDTIELAGMTSRSKCRQDIAQSDIKSEYLDILDLRMRPMEGDGFFADVTGLPSVFGIHGVKDCANHITSNDINSSEEAANNSFLSGSVVMNRRKEHCPLKVSCNQTDGSNCRKKSPQHRTSDVQNMSVFRRRRKHTVDRFLSLRSRLQIREEVIKAVSKENVKLYDAISCLSDEMRQLKSVIMTITPSARGP